MLQRQAKKAESGIDKFQLVRSTYKMLFLGEDTYAIKLEDSLS